MPTPREQLDADLKEALKARDKTRVATLRLLITALTNERIRAGKEVDEAGFLKLVRKAAKQREDSARQYRAGDREELAAQEEAEAEVLAEYLPPPVDEAEVRAAIVELIESEGLSGPAAIGPIMKATLARFGGRVDGGTINRIAREVLAG